MDNVAVSIEQHHRGVEDEKVMEYEEDPGEPLAFDIQVEESKVALHQQFKLPKKDSVNSEAKHRSDAQAA